jgi:FADH2 O2-dependent halogenase
MNVTVDRVDADVAVIGAGFAGSLAALCLRRRGRRVALVERGCHPRFAIGESSTPLANLLLEELADRYELPQIRLFSKWGTWQAARPDIAVGLKRGFTFFFHCPGEPFADDRQHGRQLLVAASPRDEVGDTHWYRPDFDRMLAEEAEAAGVVYRDQTALRTFREEGFGVVLEGERLGRSISIRASFAIDASGPRGLLATTLGLEASPPRWLPATQALYSHFTGVQRWDDLVLPDATPPYPRDDAALHHVFPGGWIWALRFGNGITSAGAMMTDPLAAQVGAADGLAAWNRLLGTLPSIAAQFRESSPTMPLVYSPRPAFRVRQVCGRRWALLPSAAGVIDPLLSTGFPLTLLGLGRLLKILEDEGSESAREAALREYEAHTQAELDATERLVASLYSAMDDPELFKRLALLYFAAASYAEAARRLGRPELAPGFLLHRHPRFGPELGACTAEALSLPAAAPESRPARRERLLSRIDRAIEPFDLAGLRDRSRRDWHPVRLDDLAAAAPKLGATAAEVHAMLERTGLVARP